MCQQWLEGWHRDMASANAGRAVRPSGARVDLLRRIIRCRSCGLPGAVAKARCLRALSGADAGLAMSLCNDILS